MAAVGDCELCSMRINNLDPARQPVRNSANLCCQELARGTGDGLGEWVYLTSSGDCVVVEPMDDYMAASTLTTVSSDSILLSASGRWECGCSPGLLDQSELSAEDPEHILRIRRYYEDGGPWMPVGAGSSWVPHSLACDELELDVSEIFRDPQEDSKDGVRDAPGPDADEQPLAGVDGENESAIELDLEVGDLAFLLESLSFAMVRALSGI